MPRSIPLSSDPAQSIAWNFPASSPSLSSQRRGRSCPSSSPIIAVIIALTASSVPSSPHRQAQPPHLIIDSQRRGRSCPSSSPSVAAIIALPALSIFSSSHRKAQPPHPSVKPILFSKCCSDHCPSSIMRILVLPSSWPSSPSQRRAHHFLRTLSPFSQPSSSYHRQAQPSLPALRQSSSSQR